MIALYCIFVFIITSSAKIWVPLGDYEYSYDESQQIAFLGPDDARAACGYLGAELAVVKSKPINDLISNLGNNQYTLIGLIRYRPGNDSFNWIDGTLVTDGSGYTNWNSDKGEPGDDLGNNEQCVIIVGGNGEWEDAACTGYKKWVCQRKIDATASIEVKTSLVTSGSSSNSTISCLDKTIFIVLVGLNAFWILVVLIAIVVLCRIYRARKKMFENETDGTMNSNPSENTSHTLSEDNPSGEYIEANFVQENENQTNQMQKECMTVDYHEGRNSSIKATYLNLSAITDEHVYAQEITSSSIPLESRVSETYGHQLNSRYINVKSKVPEPSFHTYEC